MAISTQASKKDVSPRKAPRVSPRIKNQDSATKIEALRGHIEVRYLRCGRPNCKCAKGYLHGPYYLRRWQSHGQRRSQYVKKGEVSAIFAACLEYKRSRQETRELIRQINESGNALLKAIGRTIKSWGL